MLGALVEPGEQGPRLGRDHRHLVILPGERADRFEGFEPHDRDELHFRIQAAAEELDLTEAGDLTALDALEDLVPEKRLVGIRILRGRPAMPDSADHLSISGLRAYSNSYECL